MKPLSIPKGTRKMPKSWQRALIANCKASVKAILEEIAEADDLDLWEEIDGKATDVILTYRKAIKAKAEPATFTFSDGVTRNLTVMAAVHAVAETFPDLDHDDEFPAFMGRGEKGA